VRKRRYFQSECASRNLYPGDKKNWRTAVGVVNVRQFARAVKSLIGNRAATLGAWINCQTAAEILGINEVVFHRLAKKTQRAD
jgi:hypothetical protein